MSVTASNKKTITLSSDEWAELNLAMRQHIRVLDVEMRREGTSIIGIKEDLSRYLKSARAVLQKVEVA